MKIKYLCMVTLTFLLGITVSCSSSPSDSSSSGSSSQESVKYTVTFNFNYQGAPANETKTVTEGSKVEKISDPSREGYTFVNWTKDTGGNQVYDFNSAVNSNLVLYANWQENTVTNFTVTFNYNYQGGPSNVTKTVTEGSKVEKISDPTRQGYIFVGWTKDAAGNQIFDFNSAISSDLVLYAKWNEDAPQEGFAVKFYLNDGVTTAPIKTQYVKDGYRATYPQEPSRDNYYFAGWFSDLSYETPFTETQQIKANIDVYAKWLKKYTFEAEYFDLEDKPGMGYSANVVGTDMIGKDECDMNASNGYYVSYLYYNGAFLEFEVNADKDAPNSYMELRLSVEFYDMVIGPDKMKITVNNNVIDYADLDLSGAYDIVKYGDSVKRPCENYFISKVVNLKQGKNVVRFQITNEHAYGGTMNASAPLFDCVYIGSTADLSWNPYTDNI